MEATFVIWPFLLLLLIGIIGFIFLLIKLSKKNPVLAVILILVPISIITILASLFFVSKPVRSSYPETYIPDYPSRPSENIRSNNPEVLQVFSDVMQPYMTGIQSSSNISSPIWSEAMENEFEADVYPSKTAAIRSIAVKIKKEFRNISDANEMPGSIVIVMYSQWLDLAEELRDAIIDRFPEIKCRIVADNSSGHNSNEAALKFTSIRNGQNGSFQATFSYLNKSTIIRVDYVDKPWVENFASFINSQPNKKYIIVKSNETCMSPDEADMQAMQNVLSRIRPMIHYWDPNKLQYNDIQKSGMVVDKFVQSFDGSSGKIWRESILLDVSSEKFTRLANVVSNAGRERTMGWAKMISSIVGLFVLITIVYAFLNAATKGYYSLTLKIAGVILALILLFIILGVS